MQGLLRGKGFVIAIIATVCLAFLWPDLGRSGGHLSSERWVPAGIFIIFLIQGLSLRSGEILRAGGNPRIHLFVHLWCFVGFPLAAVLVCVVGDRFWSPATSAGIIFLSLLPSTISSAVGFTAVARGNVAAALFNTVSTNFIGIFWVPAGLVLLASADTLEMGGSVWEMITRLFLLIGLPLIIGQLVRLRMDPASWRWFRLAPRLVSLIILFILFSAVCDSVDAGAWNSGQAGLLIQSSTALALLIVPVYGLQWLTLRWVGPSPADRAAAFYCGSQKTLAAGIPMAMVIFDQSPGGYVAMLILPLVILHPLQLIFAGMLAPLMGPAK